MNASSSDYAGARRAHLLDRQNERVVLLAALLDLDLQSWLSGANVRFELVELVVAGALAAVDGDQLVGIRPKLAQRLVHHLAVLGAGELELVVDQADDVALFHLEAVGARVANRMGDLDRLHAFR